MKKIIAFLIVVLFSSCSITFLPESPYGYQRNGYRNYRYWMDEYRFHNQIPNSRVIIVPPRNFDRREHKEIERPKRGHK